MGASTGPGEHVLPSLLGSFRQANPAVTVTLRVEATGTMIERVLERELELAVVGPAAAAPVASLEPFLRDRVVLAVPPGHAFAGRTVPLAELTRRR